MIGLERQLYSQEHGESLEKIIDIKKFLKDYCNIHLEKIK